MAVQVWKCSGDHHWICQCTVDMLTRMKQEVASNLTCNYFSDNACDGKDCLRCYLLAEIAEILEKKGPEPDGPTPKVMDGSIKAL